MDNNAKNKKSRLHMREQEPSERIKNFNEVPFGYNEEEAKLEADRCLQCKNPLVFRVVR